MGYEIYGLKSNPFPSGGAIIQYESKDPRNNGKIFSKNARQKEIKEFDQKFIGANTSFDDRLRCGFLWAEGDRTTGRGMGKTSLALYMKHRLNEGFGKEYFNGKMKFFCSYISFHTQLKSKIAFLYKEAFRAFIRDGIFQQIQETVSKEDLLKAGVSDAFADAIANGKVREYLQSLSRYSLDQMMTQWDQKFLAQLPNLFLNETIKALRASGFVGGVLVIDDMENLTDVSTRAEIENFVKDFGLAFFRAESEATNGNFFTLILTAHQQSAQKISQAWTVAGLSAAYPLSTGGGASLLTRRPDMDACVDMIIQHLNFYRDPNAKVPNEFFPFTKEAIETVVKECEFHPRRFLARLNRIISTALGDEVKEITKEVVEKVPEVELEESLPGIEQL